jgi:hypothetical protein
MNSEHRHELKRNELATGISDVPGLIKKHGSKLLLVLTFVLLAFAVVRYRNNQAAEQEQVVYSSLGTANNAIMQLQRQEQTYMQQQMQIAQLRNSPMWATLGDAEKQQLGGSNPEALVRMRQQTESEVRAAVQSVIDSADPDTHQAALAGAWEAQGELYWHLATGLPVETPATTQPAATTQKSPAEYLTLAKQAYTHVLESYPKQTRSVANARMSLAAIAETEGDFEAARKQYQAVIDASDSPAMEKAVAISRIAQLDDLAKPMLLAAPKPPATQPAAGLPPALGPNLPIMPSFTPPPALGNGGPTTTPAATQPVK